MLAVTSGEAGPVVTGMVYCGAIEAFHRIYDARRAQGWTEALTRWCEAQPDLAPFRGRCLVYRADLMRFHGAWPEATEEIHRAETWLLRPPPAPAVGEAYYVEAELHRLRGELDAAEGAYREAGRWGRRQDPGLALLRLAQGRGPAALVMVRRAIDETPVELDRIPLLAALVEISVAADDVAGARGAADELARLASLAAHAAALRDRRARRRVGRARGRRRTLARWRRSAGHGRCGRSWTPRTSWRAFGSGSGSPAGRSATRTRRGWSSPPPVTPSWRWGRRPTRGAPMRSRVRHP